MTGEQLVDAPPRLRQRPALTVGAIYLAARSDGVHNAEVEKFVAFADSDAGKAVLREQGLVPNSDAPDLSTSKQDARIAFVEERLKPPMLTVQGRPVSAPNATLDYLTRSAPTAPETQQARIEAARLKAAKQPKADPQSRGVAPVRSSG